MKPIKKRTTQREIARSLGVSEEAVKSRLFRARRSIRSELHKKGDLAL